MSPLLLPTIPSSHSSGQTNVPSILTRRRIVPFPIRSRIAPKASLALQPVPLFTSLIRIAHQHSKPRFKSRNLPFSRGYIINHEPALRLGRELILKKFAVGNLRHALIRPVTRAEVHVGGPVVGEVVAVGTSGAACELGDVLRGHGYVEGVSSDDLVEVRGGELPGVYEGVDAVDDDLGAAEAEHGWSGGGEAGEAREDEGVPEHGCCGPKGWCVDGRCAVALRLGRREKEGGEEGIASREEDDGWTLWEYQDSEAGRGTIERLGKRGMALASSP